jgi:hypothetical protein
MTARARIDDDLHNLSEGLVRLAAIR